MKKVLLFLTLGVMLFLVSCNNHTELDYYFGDYQVYFESQGICDTYIQEVIYEDDTSVYYFEAGGCPGDYFYYIKYERKYIDIHTAIEQEIITINQVVESGIPALVIEAK